MSLYRAVGPDEFYSVMKTKEFSILPNGFQTKQFGLNFDETLNFANKYSDIGAILETRVPKDLLNKIGDFTHVDPFLFKSGTVTIQMISFFISSIIMLKLNSQQLREWRMRLLNL